jgi:hypothetical protein
MKGQVSGGNRESFLDENINSRKGYILICLVDVPLFFFDDFISPH